MGSGEDKVKEAEAGQGKERVLDARLRELEEFLNGEFHKRVKDFWPDALKLYIDNVLDVFSLEDHFGYPLDAIVWYPYFKTGLLNKCTTRIEGISPDELGYFRVFEMRFFKGVCIDFYNAVVLRVGDSVRKKVSFIVLDFEMARVKRCKVP
jgi:hypothetical protein